MKPIDRSYCLLVANDNHWIPRREIVSVSKEFKILRAFFNEFIKIFSPSLSNVFPRAFYKTFNILVSSRNCFSRELSCSSSKLGEIQAFCWDSNLQYVLNVRQMPYCHVNFFSGITYFISVAMTLKTVLPIFFFPKDVNWTCLYLIFRRIDGKCNFFFLVFLFQWGLWKNFQTCECWSF